MPAQVQQCSASPPPPAPAPAPAPAPGSSASSGGIHERDVWAAAAAAAASCSNYQHCSQYVKSVSPAGSTSGAGGGGGGFETAGLMDAYSAANLQAMDAVEIPIASGISFIIDLVFFFGLY